MRQFIFYVLSGLIILIYFGCTEKYPSKTDEDGRPGLAAGSCVACHTDKDLLKELATSQPPPSGDTGEG